MRSREGCVIVVFLWILTEINRFNYKFCEFHPSTFDSKLKVSNSKVFIWNEKKPPAFVVKSARFLWRTHHRLTHIDHFILYINHVFLCFIWMFYFASNLHVQGWGGGVNGLQLAVIGQGWLLERRITVLGKS